MKIFLALIFLCLISLFACKKSKSDSNSTPLPPLPQIELTKGLVAYYPFNSNINDESGNGNTGSLINGSSLTYDENGKPQSALNCTGNGQKLLVQSSGKIKFDTAMTVSFNVMPRTINRSNLISMTENSSGKGTGFVIGPALPATNNLIYSIVNNEVGCDAIQTSTQVSNIDAGITLQPESWYHILCSYYKGTMKLYINGQLKSTQSSKDMTMHTCPNAQLLVGGWWNNDPSASLNGKIDEVRLYNRQLNADEIKELAKSFQ
jgi:hypothetical protein